jgi:hypothetical protein
MVSEKSAGSGAPVNPSEPSPVLSGENKLETTHQDFQLQQNDKLSEQGNGATKQVHSAALSEATAAQKPSLFTKRMFLVSPTSIPLFLFPH